MPQKPQSIEQAAQESAAEVRFLCRVMERLSDASCKAAVNLVQRVLLGHGNGYLPTNQAEMLACQALYDAAPEHLKARMDPILAEFARALRPEHTPF